MSTTTVTIYGASDDLIEVYGEIEGADEFGVYRSEWVGTLTSPDGESLIVRGEYGKPGARGEWTLSIENTESYPAWPIRFSERPGREGDPALIIEVPTGTVLTVQQEDEDES